MKCSQKIMSLFLDILALIVFIVLIFAVYSFVQIKIFHKEYINLFRIYNVAGKNRKYGKSYIC